MNSLSDSLEDYSVSLQHYSPENPLDDLKPLKEKLQDRKIIGMGEATHGTREFFRMKTRFIRFLAEEFNFKLFAWEAPFSETLKINDYVLQGDGDPRQCVEDLSFEGWQTEEVLELVETVRQYNEGRNSDDKVRFHGFDLNREFPETISDYIESVGFESAEDFDDRLQSIEGSYVPSLDSPELDEAERLLEDIERMLQDMGSEYVEEVNDRRLGVIKQEVNATKQSIELVRTPKFGPEGLKFSASNFRDYFEKVDPNFLTEIERDLEHLEEDDVDLERVSDLPEKLEQHLERKKQEYVSESSAGEYNNIVDYQIEILRDALKSVELSSKKTNRELRDQYMAENLERIQRIEGSEKAVLWGHNGHIQKSPYSQTKSMGQHLEEEYGGDYFAIGFQFRYGSFQAKSEENPEKGMTEFKIKKSDNQNLSNQLANLGELVFVNLKHARSDPDLVETIESEHQYYSAGASVYSTENLKISGNCLEGFDGLIFIEETNRARPIE